MTLGMRDQENFDKGWQGFKEGGKQGLQQGINKPWRGKKVAL